MTDDANLYQQELRVASELRPLLETHLEACTEAYNLLCLALLAAHRGSFDSLPLSRRVTEVLMIRLANDIRACAILARVGYALQSATVAASVFENAYTIALIGKDDAVAGDWVDHTKETDPFRRVRRLVIEVLRGMRVEDLNRQYALEMRDYSNLCLAKHANPRVQQGHGVRRFEGAVEMWTGPASDEETVKVASIALASAVRLAALAAFEFARAHVPEAARAKIMEARESLLGTLRRLNDLARRKGWATEATGEEMERLQEMFRVKGRQRKGTQ